MFLPVLPGIGIAVPDPEKTPDPKEPETLKFADIPDVYRIKVCALYPLNIVPLRVSQQMIGNAISDSLSLSLYVLAPSPFLPPSLSITSTTRVFLPIFF